MRSSTRPVWSLRNRTLNHLQSLLDALGSLAPSAVLLCLASAVHARALGDAARSSRSLRSLALGLAAAGIWWPLQLVATASAGPGAAQVVWQVVLMVLALGLPTLTTHAASATHSWHSVRRVAAALAALLVAAMGIAVVSSASGAPGPVWRAAIGAAVLTAALVALSRPATNRRRISSRRSSAALAAAAALVFAPVPLSQLAAAWAHPALWPTLALALFGTGLLAVLRDQQLAVPRSGPRLPLRAAEPIQDALTRLPTRTHLETQLAAAVVACDANHSKLALLFIDLDGFKPVNDTFGHSSGDRVLRSVGKRLKACANRGDVIARVGGDEFLVLIPNAGSQEDLAQRARRIIDTMAQPFEIEDRQVAVGCSIGIACYPESGQHAKLIARADAAMYAAKRAGGAGFSFFSPAMEDDARARFDLLRDLRLALENKELELFYQPKIDATTGKVTAAEALLRWQHPTRGMISPTVFIPIAERFGLIRSIGEWVIEDACRQAGVWRKKGLRMRVAINLSAVQMRQEDIVERIEGALARHHVDPSLLTCEITESVAMEDTKATQTTFRELGAAGIHLAIDDFGTGYSSLAYLHKLPAEELKIDRSFVADIEYSADARAVVNAVVKLAHALGLKVVAEGVENERQQRILVKMGCDELQGFLFAKPMTARALLLWALDDRKEHAQSFATSLFAESHERGSRSGSENGPDFESTAVSALAGDDTAKIPLALGGRAPAVH